MTGKWRKFPECEGCTLKDAPGPVFTDGDPKTAKLVVILQNPAYKEVEEGLPAVGPTGRVLNRLLFEAGIRRSEVFITNQVKCETPGNRTPSPLEIRKCKWIVEKELSLCKADTVVLAGNVAFQENVGEKSSISPAYHPKASIEMRMGCVEWLRGRKWIGIVHPASLMRLPKKWQATVGILRKAYSLAGVPYVPWHVELWPPDDIVRDVGREIVEKTGEFADDVETASSFLMEEDDYVGGDQEVTMCGVSWKEKHAILIRPSQLHLLTPAFTSPHVTRYEWNGEFDDYYLKKLVSEAHQAEKFDAMVAMHYARSYEYKRLKPEGIGLWTTLPYWNRDFAKIDEPTYCSFDAMGTLEAGHATWKELKRMLVEEVFQKYGQPLPPLLEEERVIGINVDVKRALLFMKFLEMRAAKARELITKLVGPTFNPNSHLQMRHLLYNVWKLPAQYNKKRDKDTGEISSILTTDTDAKIALKRWIEESESRQEKYKQAKMFLDLTDFVAGEESKIEVLQRISPDGKIHAMGKVHGASSFRISYSPNVQNLRKDDVVTLGTSGAAAHDKKEELPEEVKMSEIASLGSLRSIIIPDNPEEDWLFSIDFEQQELMIYAVQFNIKGWLQHFEKGEYFYGIIWEKYKGTPFFQEGKPKFKEFMLPTITKAELRSIKAVPLGAIYGRNAEAIAYEHGLPLRETDRLLNWMFSEYPEIREAHSRIAYRVSQDGFYRHVFGNIVWFPTRKLTEAYNSCAQSPAAFLLISTLIECNRGIKKRWKPEDRVRHVLTVHDSITFNSPGRHLVELAEEVVLPIATRPIPELKNFRFRVEPTVTKKLDWEEVAFAEWKRRQVNTGNPGAQSDRASGEEKLPEGWKGVSSVH